MIKNTILAAIVGSFHVSTECTDDDDGGAISKCTCWTTTFSADSPTATAAPAATGSCSSSLSIQSGFNGGAGTPECLDFQSEIPVGCKIGARVRDESSALKRLMVYLGTDSTLNRRVLL